MTDTGKVHTVAEERRHLEIAWEALLAHRESEDLDGRAAEIFERHRYQEHPVDAGLFWATIDDIGANLLDLVLHLAGPDVTAASLADTYLEAHVAAARRTLRAV